MTPKNKKSQIKIQNAFIELLEYLPLAKITVRALCNHAEINRSTFYRHFRSISQLTTATIERHFGLLFGETYKFYLKHQSIEESQFYIANNIFSHIRHDYDFYHIMFKRYPNFYITFKDFITVRYMQLFEDTGVANHMVLDKNVVAEYIASAYTGMIQGWINRQLQESPNTMAERLITLNSNGPIRLLTEAEKRIK